MSERKFKIGDSVEIISIDNMFLPSIEIQNTGLIGSAGTITKIDQTDNILPYCLDSNVWIGEVWVGDVNIKVK